MVETYPASTVQALLRANAILSDRLALARSFGQTAYEGARDYNKVLGYPTSIDFQGYMARYLRQDISGRIVDLPAQDTWRKPPSITEDGDDSTEFAQAWEALEKRLRIFSLLSRVDRISGIGRYGILYLGIRSDDPMAPSQPLEPSADRGPESLLFIRPFHEGNAVIKDSETERSDPRFGYPSLYDLTVDSSDKVPVHWSRVLHIADNRLDSDIFGIPRLERVYNRLMDLIKVVGGSAEATWLNMRPGTVITTQPGYDFDPSAEEAEKMEQEIEEYLHGLARMMTLEGVDVKTILGEMLDPTGPFEVQLRLLSAASGIPQRVLEGSAAGELAAAREDTRQWYAHIAWRQQNYAEPDILRPLIDYLIVMGVLPEPSSGSYDVGEQDDDGNWGWPPLYEMSDEEQASLASDRADAANTLRDQSTGELPITREEARQILGFPAEYPESEPVTDLSEISGEVIRENRDHTLLSQSTYDGWLLAEVEQRGLLGRGP